MIISRIRKECFISNLFYWFLNEIDDWCRGIWSWPRHLDWERLITHKNDRSEIHRWIHAALLLGIGTGIDSLILRRSVRAAKWEERDRGEEMITVITDWIASEWSLLKLLIQHESKVSSVYLLQQPVTTCNNPPAKPRWRGVKLTWPALATSASQMSSQWHGQIHKKNCWHIHSSIFNRQHQVAFHLLVHLISNDR